MRAHYKQLEQPTVRYGEHLERLDAMVTVAKYRLQVVLASWVTHRYEPSKPEAGGSVTGVDETMLVVGVEEYIFMGNEHVHRHKPILALPHKKCTPPWLYSRAINGSADFIAIWSAAEGR